VLTHRDAAPAATARSLQPELAVSPVSVVRSACDTSTPHPVQKSTVGVCARVLHTCPARPIIVGALVAGLCSGFSTGVFGTGGPPILIFVCIAGLGKGEVRASFAFVFGVSATIQVGRAAALLHAWLAGLLTYAPVHRLQT